MSALQRVSRACFPGASERRIRLSSRLLMGEQEQQRYRTEAPRQPTERNTKRQRRTSPRAVSAARRRHGHRQRGQKGTSLVEQ